MKARLLSAAALGLLVAACGTNTSDRVGGGAAAGAATGATVGAIGGPVGVLGGAAIGAGAGAATGALTTPDQVNLGRPVWNDPEVRVAGRSPASGSSASGSSSGSGMSATSGGGGNVRELQRALNNRGANIAVDGRMGPQTRNALMDFQRQNNIEASGRVDQRTASALGVSSTGSGMAQSGSRSGRSDRDGAYMGGGMVVDQNTGSSTGSTGSTGGSNMGNRGTTGGSGSMTGSGMSNQPMGNTDAQGPDRMGGNRVPPQIGTSGNTGRTGSSLGGGSGANSASPSNPGSGSNSAGSSSQ